jgi:hypothetical protein
MSRAVAREFVRAMRPVIESHVRRHGKQTSRANITALGGSAGNRTFTLQPFDADYSLDETHVILGQNVYTYDVLSGLAVGDTLLLVETDVGEWVATDVQGDTDVAPLSGRAVISFNGRKGAVAPVSGDYTVGQVTGAAPLNNASLTGTPTVPTAAPLTDNVQAASTAYVDAAVAAGALSGPAGANGQAGGDSFAWTFDTGVTNADPGSGKLRVNNATLASVTAIYVDQIDAAGINVGVWISEMLAGGVIKLFSNSNPAHFLLAQLSGVVSHTGYYELDIVNIAINGTFATTAGDLVLSYTAPGAPYAYPDAIRAGVVGITNPGVISASVASGGALTFTHWPTGDAVWLPLPSGLLVRNVVPSAPALSLTAAGITTGDCMYVGVVLTATPTPGGTATASLYFFGNRSTGATAAGDQRLASNNGTNVMMWDGIGQVTGVNYSLIAGTPATGSPIPASGRDRRPWAMGGRAKIQSSGTNASSSGSSYAPIDTTHLSLRFESGGSEVRFRYIATINVTANASGGVYESVAFIDNTATGNVTVVQLPVVGAYGLFLIDEEMAVGAGSHLYQPGWLASTGATILNGAASFGDSFTIEEIMRPTANNGTA